MEQVRQVDADLIPAVTDLLDALLLEIEQANIKRLGTVHLKVVQAELTSPTDWNAVTDQEVRRRLEQVREQIRGELLYRRLRADVKALRENADELSKSAGERPEAHIKALEELVQALIRLSPSPEIRQLIERSLRMKFQTYLEAFEEALQNRADFLGERAYSNRDTAVGRAAFEQWQRICERRFEWRDMGIELAIADFFDELLIHFVDEPDTSDFWGHPYLEITMQAQGEGERRLQMQQLARDIVAESQVDPSTAKTEALILIEFLRAYCRDSRDEQLDEIIGAPALDDLVKLKAGLTVPA
jgi:hypothetical protein